MDAVSPRREVVEEEGLPPSGSSRIVRVFSLQWKTRQDRKLCRSIFTDLPLIGKLACRTGGKGSIPKDGGLQACVISMLAAPA